MATIGEVLADKGILRGLWDIFNSVSLIYKIVFAIAIGLVIIAVIYGIKVVLYLKKKSTSQFLIKRTKGKLKDTDFSKYKGELGETEKTKIKEVEKTEYIYHLVFYGMTFRLDQLITINALIVLLFFADATTRLWIGIFYASFTFNIFFRIFRDYMRNHKKYYIDSKKSKEAS